MNINQLKIIILLILNIKLTFCCQEHSNLKKVYLKENIICDKQVNICPFAIMIKTKGLINNQTTFEFIPAFEFDYKSNSNLEFSINIHWCKENKFNLEDIKLNVINNRHLEKFINTLFIIIIIIMMIFFMFIFDADKYESSDKYESNSSFQNNMFLWYLISSSNKRKKFYGKIK